MNKILKTALFVALIIYGALMFIHISNGFTIFESLSMPTRDIRMAISCTDNPEHVWEFINRSVLESALLNPFGIGVDYEALCLHGLR
tara:strand:- start:118 stop:378 length:261 start_codon:yes stop_codon:yes gene_type:complete